MVHNAQCNLKPRCPVKSVVQQVGINSESSESTKDCHRDIFKGKLSFRVQGYKIVVLHNACDGNKIPVLQCKIHTCLHRSENRIDRR